MDAMKKRGLGFLELLAMEMKASGFYVSRGARPPLRRRVARGAAPTPAAPGGAGLSFRAAEFTTSRAELSAEQEALYDGAAAVWADVRDGLEAALVATNSPDKSVWKVYW